MAEPARRRGRRPRGGGVGRGARGARGGRGRRPRAQRSPARRTPDTVLVDLVSDSDEDFVEVATARGAAEPAEVSSPIVVPSPEPPEPAAPRADSDSDSEGADARPAGAQRTLIRRRRRLLLDPGEAPVVPVYSGKVQSSLHLIPDHVSLLKLCPEGAEEEADVADASSPHPEDLPHPDSPWKKKLRSKDEKEEKKKKVFEARDTSPLPPPPPRTKSRKHTRALQKLREVNKRLQDLRSSLSPKQHQGQGRQSQDDEVVIVEGPTLPENPRLFPLKIRCRADLIRLPIRMSEPLQSVVDHMATRLRVSPSRILLLFGETELSPTATPRTLKLGVADIIDCVVLASSSEATETSQQLRLRVQGKEKHQMLEISLSQDSPLKTLMSHYEEAMGLSGHKLSFFFDGTKLSGKELPADLGMESGDLIEVWG
ncbi:NFATC2-interacting protein [Ictidomys tridecemlineatus]|uniref:NFATC2-interacting protein n=1 Tax=Ictidomys tridecemlineatus TaxID=43179 RepID=I3MUL0_ICTTR|nr:NFATC2-interacting protein isoform X2 [Ictidomys tridecemlineatus]KAG3259552.1 nuclear factor of activated T-cells 2 interacting protein, transcript variant X2 [Ictidomys tridecemlineatus]